MNQVILMGGITKDADLKPFATSVLLTYSVAVPGVKYDSQAREEVVTTTWVSVEQWVSGTLEAHHMLYKGDKVHIQGELTQYTKPGEDRGHTRVLAHVVNVTKRGKDGLAALAYSNGAPPPPASQPSPPRQQDPWASNPSDVPEV